MGTGQMAAGERATWCVCRLLSPGLGSQALGRAALARPPLQLATEEGSAQPAGGTAGAEDKRPNPANPEPAQGPWRSQHVWPCLGVEGGSPRGAVGWRHPCGLPHRG